MQSALRYYHALTTTTIILLILLALVLTLIMAYTKQTSKKTPSRDRGPPITIADLATLRATISN
jgi:hypothetical protein